MECSACFPEHARAPLGIKNQGLVSEGAGLEL